MSEWLPLIATVRDMATEKGLDLDRFSEKNILAPFYGARFEHEGDNADTRCKADDLDAIWKVLTPEQSSLEAEVEAFLSTLGYEFVQGSFEPIYPKQLDFYFPHLNLAVEVNGDHWHREPEREESKRERAAKENIKLVFVWGSDWTSKREVVETALSEFLRSDGASVDEILNSLVGTPSCVKRVKDPSEDRVFIITDEERQTATLALRALANHRVRGTELVELSEHDVEETERRNMPLADSRTAMRWLVVSELLEPTKHADCWKLGHQYDVMRGFQSWTKFLVSRLRFVAEDEAEYESSFTSDRVEDTDAVSSRRRGRD